MVAQEKKLKINQSKNNANLTQNKILKCIMGMTSDTLHCLHVAQLSF